MTCNIVGRAGRRQEVVRRKAAKVAKAAELIRILALEDGGYTLLSRTDYCTQYGGVAPVAPAGNDRTCVPDSCWQILLKLRPSLRRRITLKWVRQTFKLPNNADQNMHMVGMFFDWFDINFKYQHNLCLIQKICFAPTMEFTLLD